ncbi:hypothetical protein [Spiroplasma alleghenense]|uniref:Transmembrane protein n=1 Tax=Spiroplasma alleghenense TaxID=216931 RepID=A0A345Z3G9_9MOLU|nr:hypothetical protein [Spiroplasma alleghenense]AXK51148.1 hypothetical protein SALLE_v1c04740 [Spiroplasma alleghenense]
MSLKWITLLVLFIIYLVSLLVTGIMALKYQIRHKSYKKIQQEFNSIIKSSEQNFLNSNIIYTCEYPLPKNETLLYKMEKIVGFKEKIKTKKNNTSNKNEIYNKEEIYLDKKILKENYSLKKIKYLGFDIDGELLLTNFRLLLKNSEGFLQIPLSEIKKIDHRIFNINGSYEIGISILTENSNYKLITDKLEWFFFLKNLI